MKHLPFKETPVIILPYFSNKYGVNLLCKRDDLFEKAYGGSKARMLQYILYRATETKYDVLVTAGGPCSNFNRACAIMCAQLHLPMHLVEYTDEPSEFKTSLNYFTARLAGMKTSRCRKTEVPQFLDNVVNSYVNDGKKVLQIYGGGKSLEGIYAYYDAVQELLKQSTDHIDEVYVACGTGTTLTGICAGFQKYSPNTSIHAISVARNYDSEKSVLNEDMSILNEYLGENFDFSNLIFHDEYLIGGYGKTNQEELLAIKEAAAHEGLLLDPIYTGKAWWGMTNLIKNNSDKTILFWNTGAIFNLLQYKDEFTIQGII